MKIVYTDSAMSELKKFQSQRKQELEAYLKDKKYVFGDAVLEVTASDIREAEKEFRVGRFASSRMPMTKMVLLIYMVLGVIMMTVGVFYSEIMDMINHNQTQLFIVLGGATLSLVSFLGSYYFKMREMRRHEFERRYIEHVSNVANDIKEE